MRDYITKIGFTGTRDGMTTEQKRTFHHLLTIHAPFELHHGDCRGADAEAHQMALELGGRIVIHPPIATADRANCLGANVVLAPKTHFSRNRDIVDSTSIVVGTPKLMRRMDRGGTWYTLDYAEKARENNTLLVIVVWPNGKVSAWAESGNSS